MPSQASQTDASKCPSCQAHTELARGCLTTMEDLKKQLADHAVREKALVSQLASAQKSVSTLHSRNAALQDALVELRGRPNQPNYPRRGEVHGYHAGYANGMA